MTKHFPTVISGPAAISKSYLKEDPPLPCHGRTHPISNETKHDSPAPIKGLSHVVGYYIVQFRKAPAYASTERSFWT